MKTFRIKYTPLRFTLSLVSLFLIFSTISAEDLENGYYIKINSDSITPVSYQKMAVTPNENCWMANENLVEAYIYLPVSEAGFSVVKVDNGVKTIFAPSANVQEVKNWLYYEPQPRKNFLRGNFEVGKLPFKVSESGLYYIAADATSRWITFLPIKAWNILGTAIPGGWEPSKLNELLPVFSADKKSAVFTIDSLEVRPGLLKFRFANGWKITVDSVSDNECWNKGTKVNVNFGGEIDKLTLGGGNVKSDYRGIYTVKLFWEVGQTPKATFTKIKDIQAVDYSLHKMGILGDAYAYNNGTRASWENNWGEGKETNVPVKKGHIYTWLFKGIKLFNGGEFKIRQGYDWTGLAVDYTDIKNWSGNAKDDFKNMDSKFHVLNSGEALYDIEFTIDASTEEMFVKVDKK